MTKQRDQKSATDAAKPREDRLKAALKANMAKRKAQARARSSETPDKKEQ